MEFIRLIQASIKSSSFNFRIEWAFIYLSLLLHNVADVVCRQELSDERYIIVKTGPRNLEEIY